MNIRRGNKKKLRWKGVKLRKSLQRIKRSFDRYVEKIKDF
jgi:hypothetical protein